MMTAMRAEPVSLARKAACRVLETGGPQGAAEGGKILQDTADEDGRLRDCRRE